MSPKCKNITVMLLLSGCLFLSGCFPEGEDGCPEDMHLSWYLDDDHVAGDFDAHVRNDVFTYIFRDQRLAIGYQIPYEQLRGGQEFVIRKNEEIAGNLHIVSWAVSAGADDVPGLPVISPGASFGDVTIGLQPGTRAGTHRPMSTDLYLGTYATYEPIDDITHHRLPVGNSACRIEVNVTDVSGTTLSSASSAYVQVNGTMDRMKMDKTGTGSPAVVHCELNDTDGGNIHFTTGRFGSLPSSEGQTVSVDIYAEGLLLATLSVPRSELPSGAQAGGLLIFDHVLGEAYYTLTVEDYTVKVYIVDEM